MHNSVNVYVDGLNLYHALCRLGSPHLRWLNLRALAEQFIHAQKDSIQTVYYCTALAHHLDKEKVSRHQHYISALRAYDVTVIEGKFKRKYKKCPLPECARKELISHEEKETDVNVAIHLMRDALQKRASKYLVITNDTDIIPAIKMVKTEMPQSYISVLTPPTYFPHKELWEVAGQRKPKRILQSHIEAALLPECVTDFRGTKTMRPEKYAPL